MIPPYMKAKGRFNASSGYSRAMIHNWEVTTSSFDKSNGYVVIDNFLLCDIKLSE